jgi:hypothetical protein
MMLPVVEIVFQFLHFNIFELANLTEQSAFLSCLLDSLRPPIFRPFGQCEKQECQSR